MIEYDKEKITDLAYVRELLEGKYLKIDDKEGICLMFIKNIIALFKDSDGGCCQLNKYSVSLKKDYGTIDYEKEAYFYIKGICGVSSFITKEEFMNIVNKVMEEIKKGAEDE
jgi:hypothetical protein